MSGSNAIRKVHYVPCLPAYREHRSVADEKQDRKAPDATSDDHRVHERADEEFAELSQGGSV